MLPRFLYHGTTGAHHNGIMFNGILPRDATGQTNWHGDYESRADAVYLTDTYPTFFASMAQAKDTKPDDAVNIVIYEIDTQCLYQKDLCADEDVLALWGRQESHKLVQKDFTDLALKLRMQDSRKLMQNVSAERSLAALGTCAHIGMIPLYAITRGLFYSPTTAAEMIIRGLDPVINLQAFRFMGEDYKQAVRWLFRFDTENAGMLQGMDYMKSKTDYLSLPNWPQFNMWRNEKYIGDVRFDDHLYEGNRIMIPKKGTY